MNIELNLNMAPHDGYYIALLMDVWSILAVGGTSRAINLVDFGRFGRSPSQKSSQDRPNRPNRPVFNKIQPTASLKGLRKKCLEKQLYRKTIST